MTLIGFYQFFNLLGADHTERIHPYHWADDSAGRYFLGTVNMTLTTVLHKGLL